MSASDSNFAIEDSSSDGTWKRSTSFAVSSLRAPSG